MEDKKQLNGKLEFTGIGKNAIISIAKVMEFGKRKYGDVSTFQFGTSEIYVNAIYRHLLDWEVLGPIDEESKLHHAEHIIWNAMAVIELLVQEGEIEKTGTKLKMSKLKKKKNKKVR